MLKRMALLVVLGCSACAPMVTHAPRVERGLYTFATAGGGASGCDSSCDLQLIPPLSAGFRYGRPAEGGRVGYSVTLNASPFIVPTDVDLYLQAPTGSSPWAMGAGVVAGALHAMPYVQLGRLKADGSGWYTTQGFAFLGTRDEHQRMFTDELQQVRPRYWAPTLTYRRARADGAYQVWVSGALGWSDRIQDRFSDNPTVAGREPVRSLMLGVTLEQRAPAIVIPWRR